MNIKEAQFHADEINEERELEQANPSFETLEQDREELSSALFEAKKQTTEELFEEDPLEDNTADWGDETHQARAKAFLGENVQPEYFTEENAQKQIAQIEAEWEQDKEKTKNTIWHLTEYVIVYKALFPSRDFSTQAIQEVISRMAKDFNLTEEAFVVHANSGGTPFLTWDAEQTQGSTIVFTDVEGGEVMLSIAVEVQNKFNNLQ